MAQVEWTPQALDDLDAICLFIARDAPQVAAVFADRAFRATDRLANYPRSGRIVPELAVENMREIILGNYRLIYRIRQDQVQVVTVHHGARCLDLGKIEGAA
jgi:addiction module RelE/StbE family toxin